MKVAIILFNLGGPDSLDAVQPFLRNLFGDPAILRLPTLIRSPLARFLSSRRTEKARAIYAKIGGSSPILGQTEAQARALEEALGQDGGQGHEWRGYVCMRYWHPMTEAVVRSVERFAPDRIVLLPLYPQFSTTTTASSFKEWNDRARFTVPTKSIESYPTEPGFIAASVELVRQGLAEAGAGPRRVLFSAHGLPERVIKAGDPYQNAGRADGEGDRRRARRGRLVDLLSEPRRSAEVDRSLDRRGDPPRRRRQGARSWSIRWPSCRSIPRPWSSSTSTTVFLPGRSVSPPTSVCRPSAPIPCSSQDSRGWCAMLYEVLKALHIIAVIAWMAGLLYLPRLFVYHADAEKGSQQSETFKIMERRLMRGIMNPAVVLVWILGLLLAWQGDWWHAGWWQVKFSLVVGLTLVHHAYALWRKDFEADRNTRPARYYRWWNEVPTVLMIAIVFLAVLKPF